MGAHEALRKFRYACLRYCTGPSAAIVVVAVWGAHGTGDAGTLGMPQARSTYTPTDARTCAGVVGIADVPQA
jgi:hypothetical protein